MSDKHPNLKTQREETLDKLVAESERLGMYGSGDIKISDAAKELGQQLMEVVRDCILDILTKKEGEDKIQSILVNALTTCAAEARRLALGECANKHNALVDLLAAVKWLTKMVDGKTLAEHSPLRHHECFEAWQNLNAAVNDAGAVISNTPPSSPWQTMDNAPRDGTKIVVRGFIERTALGPENREYFEVVEYRNDWGRFVHSTSKTTEIGSAYLTHWMPLPNKPAGGEK